MKWMRRYGWMLLVLFSAGARGQEFRYRSAVIAPNGTAAPQEAGYYHIALAPAVRARAAADLRDLRLTDSADAQQPYLVELLQEQAAVRTWQPYRYRIRYEGGFTTILIDRKNYVFNPVLRMDNADVNKRLQVEGSADTARWFAVKERLVFNPSGLPGNTARELELNLPLTLYRYLRVRISDSTSPPLNVREVGCYVPQKSIFNLDGKEPLPAPTVRSIPTWRPHQSAWTLDFDLPYRLALLCPWFVAEPYYHRPYELYAITPAHGSHPADTVPLKNGIAESGNFLSIPLEDVQAQHLLLVVNNGDSPPLTLESTNAYQRSLALLAYLKPGQQYQLLFGDDSLPAPRYDLAQVRERIKLQPGICRIDTVLHLALKPKPVVVPTKSYKQWYLWSGIGLLALVLVLVALSLLRDMEKKPRA